MLRFFDIILSVVAITLFSPILLFICLIIKITSHGPIFYKQIRVGLNNSEFYLYKFRTMTINSDQKGLLTVGGRDPRVTNFGYYLRKYKLDELPQLLNVLLGDMSIVGPRPEVRKYVDLYTDEQKDILKVKPGITDWASIIYRNENEILAMSKNPEFDYINKIMPKKITLNLVYINKYNIIEYFKIIFYTIFRILYPKKV